MQEKIKTLIAREVEAIQNIPVNGQIEASLNLIYKQVHTAHGKLVVSGMGKAGQIGYNIATTFSSTGTPAVFLHPSEAQHGDLGIIQKDDVLLLISNSGKTRELIELVHLSRRLYSEIPIITLTGHPENELSSHSNANINTGNPTEICPLGLTPTTSTTTMTVIGDVMVALMMEKINFSKEEYAKRHHSGYLGQKSRGDE